MTSRYRMEALLCWTFGNAKSVLQSCEAACIPYPHHVLFLPANFHTIPQLENSSAANWRPGPTGILLNHQEVLRLLTT